MQVHIRFLRILEYCIGLSDFRRRTPLRRAHFKTSAIDKNLAAKKYLQKATIGNHPLPQIDLETAPGFHPHGVQHQFVVNFDAVDAGDLGRGQHFNEAVTSVRTAFEAAGLHAHRKFCLGARVDDIRADLGTHLPRSRWREIFENQLFKLDAGLQEAHRELQIAVRARRAHHATVNRLPTTPVGIRFDRPLCDTREIVGVFPYSPVDLYLLRSLRDKINQRILVRAGTSLQHDR